MKKEKTDFLIVGVFGILLSYLTYLYVLGQLKGIYADYNGHTYVYFPLFSRETWAEGWMTVPYCMWHLTVLFLHRVLLIPLEDSAAGAACIYTLFAYLVLYWMFRRVAEAAGSAMASARSAILAFGTCLAQPLYFSWLDVNGLGNYTMNPLYNPPYVCMRGFSLVCFCLVCDLWGKQKDKNYRGIFFRVERGLKRYYIYLALLLFLSAAAKPTFAEMFIPAVAFVMLGELIAKLVRKDGSAAPYFRHCLVTLLCAVPTLLYIALQSLVYFMWEDGYRSGSSLLLTKWLEVWSIGTDNVALCATFGLLFPLFMILINAKYFIKSDMGKLALAGYQVGFLEAALLGEGGKLDHGNFLWPMMSGILLIFTVALMRLLVLERTQTETRGKQLLIAAAWFLFCMHVLYGIIYLSAEMAA